MGLFNDLWSEALECKPCGVTEFEYIVDRLCGLVEAQQAKIERLEKESMICCGDSTVEEWRCGADREIEEYEAPPAEPRHEDNPMAANIGETSPTTAVGGRPVAACSRCNTPNEYQDGPFTCHSCRNP